MLRLPSLEDELDSRPVGGELAEGSEAVAVWVVFGEGERRVRGG